jgi:CRP/FNR family transcriptional regulator, cyclic AMP receptor protein
MACNPEVLKHVPLFALLDQEETAVLAAQVRLKTFAPRQRIYKIGDSTGQAYVVVSGRVRVATVDQATRRLWSTNRRTESSSASRRCWSRRRIRPKRSQSTRRCAWKSTRKILPVLLQRKPLAGMDMLRVLGRQFHASQQLVRLRANRNPNEVIDKDATFGERIADVVAGFGGSWTFIIAFSVALAIYMTIDAALGRKAWDPYPYILLNLFLSMLAAVQAPVIMMSQNRQDTKDRLRGELDYDVNRRSEAEIQGLARKLNLLGEKIGDVEDMVRDKLGPG